MQVRQLYIGERALHQVPLPLCALATASLVHSWLWGLDPGLRPSAEGGGGAMEPAALCPDPQAMDDDNDDDDGDDDDDDDDNSDDSALRPADHGG